RGDGLARRLGGRGSGPHPAAAVPDDLLRLRMGDLRPHPHARHDLHAQGPGADALGAAAAEMSMLTVDSLTMAFGGLRAIDELSFEIRPGPVHSIIGPNGAGKTTLFNLITGVYQPTSGRILLDGQDLARRSAHQRACSGMNRTFQNLQICMNMTALANVTLGEHQHLDHRFLPALLSLPRVRRGERESRERSAELMAFVGLSAYIDSDASAMPYGALKRLEIARALAARPRL